jgi:hypothetical protein
MMPESLRALLANAIDYAGLYPPSELPLPEVIAHYRRYLVSPEAWMLNRLVLPIDKLHDVALEDHWRVTLLVNEEPGSLARQVETLETKASKRLSLPTYCEVPLDRVESGYAKIRTANISPDELADFLSIAAARRLPFKATAGLHHAIRSTTMHGFINVFVAATLAWLGMDHSTLVELLNETDPQAFEFRDDELRWRDHRASTGQVARARSDFAHSFGSCSFEDPVSDLRVLGLLQ